MRIYVYAICKNEEKFAESFMNSIKEADGVIILDTGSTDNTVSKLRELGAIVHTATISPWRFDEARNKALGLVPDDADLCLSMDLDEVAVPGWRKAIEKAYDPKIKQYRYRFVWSFQPDGTEGYVFWVDKLHAKKGFKWVGAVHEVLSGTGDEAIDLRIVEGMQVDHHPDPAKSRGQYLPLLEKAVEEDPQNDRNMHYLGREYFFYREWEKCIQTLDRHLNLPGACWADERCASLRYMAKSYNALDMPQEADRCFLRAISQAPHLREPYIDYAMFLQENEDWHGVIWAVNSALKIKERPRTYITEADCWGYLPYDLLALAEYNLGDFKKALEHGKLAVKLADWIPRLKVNLKFYEEAA